MGNSLHLGCLLKLDWQHYDFKNKLVDVKERVQTMLLGYRDRNFDEAPAIPLRLKRIKNILGFIAL